MRERDKNVSNREVFNHQIASRVDIIEGICFRRTRATLNCDTTLSRRFLLPPSENLVSQRIIPSFLPVSYVKVLYKNLLADSFPLNIRNITIIIYISRIFFSLLLLSLRAWKISFSPFSFIRNFFVL